MIATHNYELRNRKKVPYVDKIQSIELNLNNRSKSLTKNRKINRLRRKVMTIIANNLQFTRNNKPLRQSSINISIEDFIFLKNNYKINGRFKESLDLEKCLNLSKKNILDTQVITIDFIRFRLVRGRIFKIKNEVKEESFFSNSLLVIKFLRTR